MTAAHESDRLRNSLEWTVTVTGGARPATADARAERLAERIVNAAARLSDVVEVTARRGAAVTARW